MATNPDSDLEEKEPVAWSRLALTLKWSLMEQRHRTKSIPLQRPSGSASGQNESSMLLERFTEDEGLAKLGACIRVLHRLENKANIPDRRS